MAVTRKTTTTTDTNPVAFNKIPKSKLFSDDPIPPPMPQQQVHVVQPAPQVHIVQPQQQQQQPVQVKQVTTEEQTIDPLLLLLLSLFNNSNQPAPAPYPYPMMPPTSGGGGNCPNYYPNLPADITEIKMKLEELKGLVGKTPKVIETKSDSGEKIVYDDSGIYDLINRCHDESWNKLLDIEARLIELQNEHYDIYNLVNSTSGSSDEYYEEYYEEPQPQPAPSNNDEYEEYEEVTTTTVPVDNGEEEYYDEYSSTTTEEYGQEQPAPQEQDYYEEQVNYDDYYMNKKNYKEFMQALKKDIVK